ncbi:MAG TPA: exodeoxyribonuclease VII large subunit [Polyangiaceae bacterium]|jgi:exodeoxyribonuclease VII large subunit
MAERRDQGDLWPPPYPTERFTEYEEAPPPARDQERDVLTVAELGRAIARGVERAVPRTVWVEGEVVGSRPAASGHLYFTLKDQEEDAAIDVVMYRASLTNRTRAIVRDGARLRVRGRPAFWAQRGRLQFTADRLELAGRGAILEAIEKLKVALAAEGLFAAERKRALPKDPRTIGVVTSAGGAVIHDICKVAARRGGAHVLLAPARVQGDGAAESVTRSLRMLEKVATVDVIIVGRGGGSFDELLVWSDEALVRAVARCRVPIVSAVGHEVDVTLTDFAADKRAATPSQAAEMCVPDRAAWKREARHLEERLVRCMRAQLGERRAALAASSRALDPRRALAAKREALASAAKRLSGNDPRAVLERERADLKRVTERIVTLTRARVVRDRGDLGRLMTGLDAMSPLRVLGRGYAIATHDGIAVREAREVKPDDVVEVRVHHGRFEARVSKVEEDEE